MTAPARVTCQAEVLQPKVNSLTPFNSIVQLTFESCRHAEQQRQISLKRLFVKPSISPIKSNHNLPKMSSVRVWISHGAMSSFLHVLGTLSSSLSTFSTFPKSANKLQIDHAGEFLT